MQDPARIPIQLQNMPTIYRAFEVVILLPNAPCSCFREALAAYEADDETFRDTNGDFELYKTQDKCPNAIPISSYHFRLWTKQEFAYASQISIHYCGLPGGSCGVGYSWLWAASRIPTNRPGQLSKWAQRKYEDSLAAVTAEVQSELMAWSSFRAALVAGRDNLISTIWEFYLKQDLDYHIGALNRHLVLCAKFLLGAKLERTASKQDEVFIFASANLQHLATVKQDFAVAVFPAMKGYVVPTEWADMPLPDLLTNGLEQYEQRHNSRMQTILPKGLFEIGPASMRCVPTMYLRHDMVSNYSQAYGAILAASYRPVTVADHVMLRVRDPPASRLPLAKTYRGAFGGRSTDESRGFVKKVTRITHYSFGNKRNEALTAWAGATIRGHIAVSDDSWPSAAHEKAIFEESLHSERSWSSWPEVDHERVCFELLCDWASIHPDVARAKQLGLVVKTADPPCIGFVNGKIYDAMRKIERRLELQDRGITDGDPCFTPGPDDAILAEEWLSIVVTNVNEPASNRFLVLEALNSRIPFDPALIHEPPRDRPMPTYMALGVWFWSRKDDPSIGAELATSWSRECNAMLL